MSKCNGSKTPPKTGRPNISKTVAVAKFASPPDKEAADALAALALKPSANAAAVVIEYTKAFGEQDIGAIADSLSASMDALAAGDMHRAEAMLYGQAHALQALFVGLARRAASQENPKHWEAQLRMALKAQNQCRMTLETLATVRNPPVIFARQANINNGGQQQVNNGAQTAAATGNRSASARVPAVNSEIVKTGLLEANDGQRLDTGTTRAASSAHSDLEAVGEVHRSSQC